MFSHYDLIFQEGLVEAWHKKIGLDPAVSAVPSISSPFHLGGYGTISVSLNCALLCISMNNPHRSVHALPPALSAHEALDVARDESVASADRVRDAGWRQGGDGNALHVEYLEKQCLRIERLKMDL